MLKTHPMLFAFAPDGKFQKLGQCVDNRNANAVESAGHLIGIVVGRVLELAAGMQLSHDNFSCRNAFFLVHASWNAATIIFDRYRTIGIEFDQHKIAMPRERLVDGIVGNFKHHVMQATAIIGVADIHAWALAHCIQAFQNLDAIGTIFILVGVSCAIRRGIKMRGFRCFFSHSCTVGPKPKKPKEKRLKVAIFPQSFMVGDNEKFNSGFAI